MAGRAARTVDELLAAARARIERVEPECAWAAASAGEPVIVDIRCDDDRRRDGTVPGALHIPRTVLEWRVDPSSGWCNPHVGERDRRVLLLCAAGFSSSLAAASLLDLGFQRVGDVIGGFRARRGAGLPIGVPAGAGGRGACPGWARRTSRRQPSRPRPSRARRGARPARACGSCPGARR